MNQTQRVFLIVQRRVVGIRDKGDPLESKAFEILA